MKAWPRASDLIARETVPIAPPPIRAPELGFELADENEARQMMPLPLPGEKCQAR